ncbi:formyl transferase [Halostagnicola larsenii XH-48]|uniref:Formyl transferase n=1 Tax=Halostagnicola larsenii XH-48 TaxID=797299 RepID=W0JRY9_9EURY|nr:formyltransferase family protein [Halostagnicola larsenii]AHG00062.1 formyl transferase [Halostagnicola larsenii XH-48]
MTTTRERLEVDHATGNDPATQTDPGTETDLTAASRPKTGPRRVCLLADPYLERWQIRALERAIERTDIEIPLVLVAAPADPDVDPEAAASAVNGGLSIDTIRLGASLLARERAWSLVVAERKLAELVGPESHPLEHRQRVGDVDCLESSTVRHVRPIEDGNWNELPESAVEAAADRCDVVVRFGFGLVRGDILTATEHGVLSFHPADIRRYRGLGPPKAFVDDRSSIGATLQRLTEGIDSGEIVAEDWIDIDDCATLWDVYDRVHELEVELLATGIESLRDPGLEPTVPDSLGAYYSTKSRREVGFALRTLAKNLRGRLGLR